jgi:hypothetical protein
MFYMENLITSLKTKINFSYAWKYSSYSAVNTLRLNYKDQSANAA